VAYNPYNLGQFNTSLPTLTTGQYSVIQLDSNGRIILSPQSVTTIPTIGGGNTNIAVQDNTPGTQPIHQEILQELRMLRRLFFLVYQESGEGNITQDLQQDVNGFDTVASLDS